MEYKDFKRLLENGASSSCIFMKDCMAFNGSTADDAELAKNIIALANNETAINYIIIGVSNDNEYITVENHNLSDENLQNFCRNHISPTPAVKLEWCRWENVDNDVLKSITFVVIQVETEARKCFRFNQDFIDTKQQCYIKKGEVWVRHKASTDFASPEEIRKLFEKKRVDPTHHKVSYTGFPYATAIPYILDQLEQLAGQVGGKVLSDVDPFIVRGGPSLFHHIVLPVNGKPLLLRVILAEKCEERGQVTTYNNIYLTFEHGMLLISLGDVVEAATSLSRTSFKEAWGWFCTHEFWHPGLKERKLNIPLAEELKTTVGDPSSLCFVLTNVTTNDLLEQRWADLIDALQNQTELIRTIETQRARINNITASYLAEGCPLPTNKTFKPKNLLGNEMWDPKKYGNLLLNRQPEVCNALQSLLDKMND